MPESKFNKFVGKLKAEGYSNKSAHNIAAAKGAAKYGWHEMARRSAASRKRHEEQHA